VKRFADDNSMMDGWTVDRLVYRLFFSSTIKQGCNLSRMISLLQLGLMASGTNSLLHFDDIV